MVDQLRIVAAGDVFPSGCFFSDGAAISPEFEQTLRLLRSGELAFANFEMPLSDRGQPLEKLANIRADPAISQDVGEIGFSVVSLANNHSMDYGFDALCDTRRGLEARQIRCIGAGASIAEAAEPAVVEAGGWRVGFLAFCCLVPPGGAATPDRPGIAPIHIHSSYEVNPYWQIEEPGEPAMITIHTRADEADQQFAEARVRELAATVDFLCLSMHWGYGASETLAEYQRPVAHSLLDAGADVIFGNHVHAVQGVESYHGKTILYSPGTFIGRQPSGDPHEMDDLSDLVRSLIEAMSPDGYVATLEINKRDDYAVRLTPTTLDPNGLPRIVTGSDFERIAERIVRLSAKLGTAVEIRENALHIEADAREP